MNFLSSRRSLTLLRSAVLGAVIVGTGVCTGAAWAQAPHLAPNFVAIQKGAKVVIMPPDIELFSLSAGGVSEPKADWTEAAVKHFKTALSQKKQLGELDIVPLSSDNADLLSEVNTLHGAVASAIALHHFGSAILHLPTKNGKLDWSMGEPVALIKQKTGADYALFSWIRDTYASGERKATMLLLAAAGIGIVPGIQIGYASLVDLNSGQIVWFNAIRRPNGDMRELEPAKETLNALLAYFPAGSLESRKDDLQESTFKKVER